MKLSLRLTLALTFAGLVFLAACRQGAPLPVYWTIPGFELTSQSGQPFASKSLEGNIWVADFIYTTCPGPCPRMSAIMRGIQSAVKVYPDVKLVSFTVDPKYDTPAVLARYAAIHHAQSGRWFFLTGNENVLENVCRNGFKLGDVDGSLQHSTRFTLLDRHSRVRGYYSPTEDATAVPHLLRDIRRLESAKS